MNEPLQGSPPAGPDAPGAAAASPLGSPGNYHATHATIIREDRSVTGATVDDPSASLTRQSVLFEAEPDWANPLSGVKTVVREYATSFLLFWFTYGIALASGIFMVGAISGEYRVFDSLVMPLCVAPVYGIFLDAALISSKSSLSVFGIFFGLGEVLLGLFFLVTHDWSERRKYLALTLALGWTQVLVFVLGGLEN